MLYKTAFRRRLAPWYAVSLAAAFVGSLTLPAPALALDGENYVIPATDGYGIAECLHTASACGRLMADSWCEAHGHAHAIAYGTGADMTGSTPEDKPMMKLAAGDIVIRCGD